MSTLGNLIKYSLRTKTRKREGWLPRDKWEAKLKKEGKWVDYKNQK